MTKELLNSDILDKLGFCKDSEYESNYGMYKKDSHKEVVKNWVMYHRDSISIFNIKNTISRYAKIEWVFDCIWNTSQVRIMGCTIPSRYMFNNDFYKVNPVNINYKNELEDLIQKVTSKPIQIIS